ncbi:venom carboxylesterase-6-like isoform X2 [Chelonus insularis]|uniref:venom carboxylesterase-6-like isoform X2 n=1 Tax=Chelonus insularis TaxID=460826 RepID=UPI00158F03BD|nr:venom carboxylesterase-6-like isoform X2 [Chelonus insularis]
MQDPIIKVQQGQLRGTWESSFYGVQYVAFKGVPYAKPPIGNLRFKDPEPVEPWSGIRDATKFGYSSPQNNVMLKAESEDCLFLNIYTSNLNLSVAKPVMVWIHGGAFYLGSGDDSLYGPDYLIHKEIVLVTINYRLGVLGFLNVDDEEAPGNQGLKDQVLALKWVQQNISRFGGDPHNVTIFGESAGAASVHYLTISPLAQGLFNKAIMQSGVAVNPWAAYPYSPKEAALKFASLLGSQITDSKEIVKFLRTIDLQRLLENSFFFLPPFGPTVDNKSKNPFLPVPIREAIKQGVQVPCIFGYTSREGVVFMREFEERCHEIDIDPENLLIHPSTKKILEEKNITVNDMRRMYLADKKIDINSAEEVADLLSATQIIIGIHQILMIQAQFPNIPAYLYKFDYEIEVPLMQKLLGLNMKGTCHGEDIAFLFLPKIFEMIGKVPPPQDSTEYFVIQRFIELWTNFAKIGNPTPLTSKLIPIDWKPINNPIEYSCLNISEDLSMIKEKNILLQIEQNIASKL